MAPMTMTSLQFRTRVRLTLLTSAVVAAVTFTGAQQPAIPAAVLAASLDQTVPVDPLITVGTLPNGFRYYIRENRQPQGRAELRLAVNVGSVLEDDDQLGLAHFVEHMSFNGTRHFPKQDIGTFMQSLGMRFGAHVNAHTSFDETVYELQIPTRNAAVIDRSLLILVDFARDVSFDPVEIDKERGVVLEEWRLGLGASERIRNAQLPLLLADSRYAERHLCVSNSLSGRHWELDQVPAVGDLTDIVQLGTGHHVSVGEGQRRVALQRRVAAHLCCRRPDARRHATVPQSWIQREN